MRMCVRIAETAIWVLNIVSMGELVHLWTRMYFLYTEVFKEEATLLIAFYAYTLMHIHLCPVILQHAFHDVCDISFVRKQCRVAERSS